MKRMNRISQRAVTLTELLVVLAIISLLATLAVPVYISQLNRARFSVAQAETRNIAQAQEQVAIFHGFYVPIHILDNVPNTDGGVGGSATSRDDFDNLTNASSHFLIDAGTPLEDQAGASQVDLGSTTDIRVQRLIENWQGPFLQPQRVRFVGEDPADPTLGDLTLDLVVDPWGNPYRFYTDLGLAGDAGLPTVAGEDVALTQDNLALRTGAPEQDRFDRFAIVSYGPDGVSGFDGSNPLSQGDDVVYQFVGVSGNETRFSNFP